MTSALTTIKPRWRWNGIVPRLAANGSGVAVVDRSVARLLAWTDGRARWAFPLPVREVIANTTAVIASGFQDETFVIDSEGGEVSRVLPNASGLPLETSGSVLIQRHEEFMHAEHTVVSATDFETARTLWRVRWPQAPSGRAAYTLSGNWLLVQQYDDLSVTGFDIRSGTPCWTAPGHSPIIVDEEHFQFAGVGSKAARVLRLKDGKTGPQLRVGNGRVFAGGRHHSVVEERGQVILEVKHPFTGKGRRCAVDAPIDQLRDKPRPKARSSDQRLKSREMGPETLSLKYADATVVLLGTKRPGRFLCARTTGEAIGFLEFGEGPDEFFRQGPYLLVKCGRSLECFELDLST